MAIKIKNSNGEWVVDQKAIETSIIDLNGNFESTNIEGALRELVARINIIEKDIAMLKENSGGTVIVGSQYVMLEDGTQLMLEDGSYLLLESSSGGTVIVGSQYVMLEDGTQLMLENGSYLLLESF